MLDMISNKNSRPRIIYCFEDFLREPFIVEHNVSLTVEPTIIFNFYKNLRLQVLKFSRNITILEIFDEKHKLLRIMSYIVRKITTHM